MLCYLVPGEGRASRDEAWVTGRLTCVARNVDCRHGPPAASAMLFMLFLVQWSTALYRWLSQLCQNSLCHSAKDRN